jgi:orotate phosphoribosyltransferase/GNAT superfamily N-acetyltransferase
MAGATPAAFFDLVRGRRGHFRLESGHHSRLWFDLDPLLASARRIDPFVSALASAVGRYDVQAVCGPLVGGAFVAQLVARTLDAEFCFTERIGPSGGDGLYGAMYRLPAGFASRLKGTRVAIVDDVMSAGSAARGSYTELVACGATPVVVGALLVLGAQGAMFFADERVPVEAVVRADYELWSGADCPLCAEGVPVEDPGAAPDVTLRVAEAVDVPVLQDLIERSARGLSIGYYSDREIEAAIRHVFGVDTTLIADRTYFIIERGGRPIACGGWSGRRTLYGGDQRPIGDAERLDPAREAARIRAFFVAPEGARQGFGRLLYGACEDAARRSGFRSLELMATLPGVPFYEAMGFEEVEPVTDTLPDGVPIRFVKMRRLIAHGS